MAASARTRAYQALASERRVEILAALRAHADGLGVEAIAQQVGLHVNTVREHLDRLVACGFVTRAPEHRTTRGRPRIVFKASDEAPEPLAPSSARDQLMQILVMGYGEPTTSAAEAACDAGRAWSRARAREDGMDGSTPGTEGASGRTPDELQAHQMSVLDEHLVALGFDPEPGPDPLSFRLRRCPVHDLAESRPELVCAIHFGGIKGVLEGHPGPVTAQTLLHEQGAAQCTLRLAVGASQPDR